MSEAPAVQQAEEVEVAEVQVVDNQNDSTDPASDNADESTENQPEDKQPEEKKKTHDERRWERLLKERAEFKAKAELYEQMHSQQKKAPDPASGRPSRADFDDDESYVDSLTSWKVEQKLAGVQERISQAQQQTQAQSAWVSKVNQARTDYADYNQVMEDAQDIPISPAVAEAIQSSDLGADVAYYLGKNPGEAERINQLSPMAAAREIGRIESYVEYEKQNAKKVAPVSKAPSPIKPVRSGTGGSTKDLETMTPGEYSAYMNKRERERKTRR